MNLVFLNEFYLWDRYLRIQTGFYGDCRVSNVIDYSLTRNYVQLRLIIFISCNFAGLRVIEEISISRNYGVISCNFYNVISRNFVMIMRKKRNSNYA